MLSSSSLCDAEIETPLKEREGESTDFVCAGIIVSPHGIQGHLKVKCFLENPKDLRAYSPFSDEKGEETYKVNKVLAQIKDLVVLSLDGVKDRTAAEALRGAKLMFPRIKLPLLSEDIFYHADLIGLQVRTSQNHPFGTVTAVHNFGAGDILEIQTLNHKSVMLPFSQEMVPEINIQERFVRLSEEGEL